MTKYLYRFRSAKNLIGEFAELEKQEIYFAAPNELNDPMEGFKDIFWQGDKIVWRNLFRHYILCLNHGCSLFSVLGEEHRVDLNLIPIHDPYGAFNTEGMNKLQDTVLNIFFSNPLLGDYIERLANRKQPVRQNELCVRIQCIQWLAILSIYDAQHKCGLSSKQNINLDAVGDADSVLRAAIASIDAIEQLELNNPENEFATDSFYALQKNLFHQQNLIYFHNKTIDVSQKNRIFLFLDFPESYVQEIERLVHPNWYAACFMKHCQNSSSWGHYGDGHRGVCLKFKVQENNDRYLIQLNRISGWSMSGAMKSDVPHEFFPIKYHAKHVAIDFFKTFGSLPIPNISKNWYRDDKGNLSTCAVGGIDFDSEQRANYWKNFNEGATTKLDDWKFEEEYRLLIHGHLIDFSKPENRLARYNFQDLDGIIFGIKTSKEDKLQISKIVEEKCRKFNRNDFKFYQAYYSRQNERIEYTELSLLKFTV